MRILKKKIALFTLMLFVIFTSLSYKVFAESQNTNLFNNPSLESGCILYDFKPSEKTTNWKQVSWANVDNGLGYARTGNANAYMTFSYEGLGVGEFPTLYQDVEVEKNSLYAFTFFAKRWGDAPSQPLYVGIRNRTSLDPWASIDVTQINDFTSEEYTKITTVFYTYEYTELRFAIHTQSVVFDGKSGGYHLDDFSLTKVADFDSATVDIDENIEVGRPIKYETKVKLKDDSVISSNESSSVVTTFESSNETVICTNQSGVAIPLKTGNATLDVYVTFCGKKIKVCTKEINVLDSHIPTTPYIKQISLSMSDPLINTNYSEVYVSTIMSNDQTVSTEDIEITVSSSNNDICFVEKNGKKIQAIGVSGGNATIYVMAKYNGFECIGKLNVTVENTNYLKDPSFECYESNPVWTFDANCGIGIDSGLLNGLSHTGYSNVWMMAPVYWEPNCLNTSTVDIYQTVHLNKGQYELSAYINRFYATGVQGTLASIGGLVKLGAMDLNNNDNNQYAEFDVSYGFGGFQRLSTLITVEEESDYKVYFRVEGDEVFGLGMQLDDMYLIDAIYPKTINAYLLDDNFGVDDLAKIVVEATYDDGSKKIITNGFRIIPEDYSVLYESGGFLIGRNDGTTKVKIKANILQKPYETEITIKVGTGVKKVKQNIDNNSTSKIIIITSSIVVGVGLISGVYIILKKRGIKKCQ